MKVNHSASALAEQQYIDPVERYPGYERGRLLAAVEALSSYYPPQRPRYKPRLPIGEFLEASERLLEVHPSVWNDFVRFARYAAWLREYGPECQELLSYLAPAERSLARKKKRQIEAVLSASRKGRAQ